MYIRIAEKESRLGSSHLISSHPSCPVQSSPVFLYQIHILYYNLSPHGQKTTTKANNTQKRDELKRERKGIDNFRREALGGAVPPVPSLNPKTQKRR